VPRNSRSALADYRRPMRRARTLDISGRRDQGVTVRSRSQLDNPICIPNALFEGAFPVLVVGVICLLLGLLFGVSILTVIGLVLVVIGGVLWIAGSTGHKVGSRAHYW
jgi:fatty-acid desaturase